MRKKRVLVRLKGKPAVTSYQKHALTPAGKLRHDLLFLYYRRFIKQNKVKQVFDLGGGSGLLIRDLLREFPYLKATLIDDDPVMLSQAENNLKGYLLSQRLRIIRGSIAELFMARETGLKNILVSFNHVIEYMPDQQKALISLARLIPKGSFLGVMYLNNSHEAMRKIFFKDSIAKAKRQLRSHLLDLVYFGKGRALDPVLLNNIMLKNNLFQIQEYGLRCVCDLKPVNFSAENYRELLDFEYSVGMLEDFMGLARYRLKFFQRKK